MKSSPANQKSPRPDAASPSCAMSAGPAGRAIAPPTYGIASIDRVSGQEVPQPVQRKVNWAETEVKNMDLIDTLMSGADFGFTAILVNGRDNNQQNPYALNEPTYELTKPTEDRAELRVVKDAQNTLGTRMQLPTDPPWQRDVDKDRVGNLLWGDAKSLGVKSQVENYIGAQGQTRLTVGGDPDDATLARLTKKHEQQHVADDKAVQQEIVAPWDAAMSEKRRTNAVTIGATPIAALQQFHHDVGGSGADIGKAYMDECVKRGNDFHKTAPGGKPKFTKIQTSPDQSTISATWKHPVEEGLLAKLFGL